MTSTVLILAVCRTPVTYERGLDLSHAHQFTFQKKLSVLSMMKDDHGTPYELALLVSFPCFVLRNFFPLFLVQDISFPPQNAQPLPLTAAAEVHSTSNSCQNGVFRFPRIAFGLLAKQSCP